MCDYSLMVYPNRLATTGEELVVKKFGTGSIGLTPPAPAHQGWWAAVKAFFDPPEVPAVCIPPGALLKLSDIPQPLQSELGVGPEEDVVFTEISAVVNNYRDAVRFANGKEILLQRLEEGQHVKVLDLFVPDRDEPSQASQWQPDWQFTL